MTAALTDLDPLTLADLQPPCDVADSNGDECHHPAAWVGVARCCGWTLLMCDPHHEGLLELIAGPRIFHCSRCHSDESGNPFASIERL